MFTPSTPCLSEPLNEFSVSATYRRDSKLRAVTDILLQEDSMRRKRLAETRVYWGGVGEKTHAKTPTGPESSHDRHDGPPRNPALRTPATEETSAPSRTHPSRRPTHPLDRARTRRRRNVSWTRHSSTDRERHGTKGKKGEGHPRPVEDDSLTPRH